MRIEHMAMYVRDLEGARDFFIRYFQAKAGTGYHNRSTDFRSYFLTFEDGARLELMQRPELDARERSLAETGYIHLAFGLGSREAVDALTARFREDGWEILSGPRITGDGYYESCVLGFEGNQIELTI